MNNRYATIKNYKIKDEIKGDIIIKGFRLNKEIIKKPVFISKASSGDFWDLIAKRFFKNEFLWWHIVDHNAKKLNPLEITSGENIYIPIGE